MQTPEKENDLTLNVEELAALLESDAPLTVVDVRPSDEREEWYIPGSTHIDAYDALKQHDPEALSEIDLPDDRPIVTVCAAGNTSKTAARLLRDRGKQARSLEGGMKAWSLAHNTAEFSSDQTPATVVQVRRTGKGCLSYLVGIDGEAAVIDASLPPDVYVELAESKGWRITRVLDTHIHADHLSRSRALVALTGSDHYLPEQQRVSFPFEPVHDGDTLTIGNARLQVIHTPGHTDESVCFLLDNAAIFTGDTLFVDGVGRPDLKTNDQKVRTRAGVLYESLQRILREIPADVLVLPGHTGRPVPFDDNVIGETLETIRVSIEALSRAKESFVDYIVNRIPPTPPNFERIVELNEAGAAEVDDILDLEAGANRCAIS